MEQTTIKRSLSNLLFKEALPFTKKRDLNWKTIRLVAAIGLVSTVIVILVLPSPKPETKTFYEKSDSYGHGQSIPALENNPTEDTLAQLQSARRQGSSQIDYLNDIRGAGGGGSGGGGGASQNRNTPMIISRGGIDGKTQLPPGSRITVTLTQSLTLNGQSMPIIATVNSDVIQENSVAISQGAKLYGDANFDDSSERVLVNWKTVQFPDGSMRPLNGIGVGHDGQVGVEGNVHSDGLKSTIGQTVTRFIGAYAEGSMQRGAAGSNPGGNENGWKNAISETAKDQANNWAEDMKKERKWVELKAGIVFSAVVTQAFQFRDPGATYGR